jgi:hypothetical protein
LCAKANRAFQQEILRLDPSVTDASMCVEKYRRFVFHQMSKQAPAAASVQANHNNSAAVGSAPAAPPSAPAVAPSVGDFASSSRSPAPAAAVGGSFSFGAKSSSTSASTIPAAETAETGTESFMPTDGSTANAADKDGIQATIDSDWDDVKDFETVQAFHVADPKDKCSVFAKFAQGKIRVQFHKTDKGQHRILMRDKTGLKVLLNMKVTKDMTFEWKTAGTRKNVQFGEVTFYGTNKEERGYELIRLMAPVDVSKNLFEKLKQVQ